MFIMFLNSLSPSGPYIISNLHVFTIIANASFPLTVVPSAPSAISLLHCTGTEMVLGWRAPVNNGGEPVDGYFLDQREKSQGMWHEVNVKPVRERVYTVSHSTFVLPLLQRRVITVLLC